jgi:hypothetical protein
MNYFTRLRDDFRFFRAVLKTLPSHPYSPFYARWETVLHLRLDLLRQQAEEARQAQELGVLATWKGWVLVVPTEDQHEKASPEVPNE